MSITTILFLVFFMGLLLLAVLKHPIFGIICYLLTLYAFPPNHWWGVALPNLRWALAPAAVAFIGLVLNKDKLVQKKRWYKTGSAKILVMFTVWMWIQSIWASDISNHVTGTILFTKYVFLFYLIYEIVNTEILLVTFVVANVLGGLLLGIEVLHYSTVGRVEFVGGPGINDSNSLGMHLAVLLVFASMMLLKKKNSNFTGKIYLFSKLIVCVSIPFIANGIVQTRSRSSFLALVVAGLCLLIVKPKRYSKAFYFFAILAVILGLIYTPDTFWKRMTSIKGAALESEYDGSMETRIILIKAQMEMFFDHPLGSGHKGTGALSGQYLDSKYLTSTTGRSEDAVRTSHNTYMTILVEQGVPGAVLAVALGIWLLKASNLAMKAGEELELFSMAMIGSLCAIYFAGLFVDYIRAEVQIWCLSVLTSLAENVKSEEETAMNVTINNGRLMC